MEDWLYGCDGGTLIYAQVNPQAIGGWDIEVDSAYFMLGKGQ